MDRISARVLIEVVKLSDYARVGLNSKECWNFSDILINGRFNQVRTGVTGKSISKDEDKIVLFMQHLGHLS